MGSRHDIQRFLRQTRAVFTVGAASIGAVALIGWLLGVDALERVVIGQVPMKANTAVCLLLLRHQRPSRTSSDRIAPATSNRPKAESHRLEVG
jgi:hypothetical protein